jgi:hypothetical protein
MVKVKLFLCLTKHHDIKTCCWWMYSAMHIWPRHWKEVSSQLHAPVALVPGNQPPLSIAYEAGWVPDRSGHGGEEKNFQPPPKIETRTLIVQRVASLLIFCFPSWLTHYIVSMSLWGYRYEGVSKIFRTESILVEKHHKGLWRQNSLDWLIK